MKASMFAVLNMAKDYLSIRMDPSMKGNGKQDTAADRASTHTQMVTGMKDPG